MVGRPARCADSCTPRSDDPAGEDESVRHRVQPSTRTAAGEHPGAGLGPCSRHPKNSATSRPCSTTPWRAPVRTCAASSTTSAGSDARQLTERLQGMRLLVLATVTADGRPLAGPVDGYFLHGTFWFSSGTDSVRMRHLAARPAVQRDAPARRGPRRDGARAGRVLRPPTTPAARAASGHARRVPAQAGSGLRGWLDHIDALGARIEPEKMFTFHLDG